MLPKELLEQLEKAKSEDQASPMSESSVSSTISNDDIEDEAKAGEMAKNRVDLLGFGPSGYAREIETEKAEFLKKLKSEREANRAPQQIPKQLQDVLGQNKYASELPSSPVSQLSDSKKDSEIQTLVNNIKSKAEEEGEDYEEPVALKAPTRAISSKEPVKKAEEPTSDLEKQLAEASKKDLEERTKYSDLLKDALQKRDFSQLAAQLGRASAQIGAGIGGTVERGTVTKPVGMDIYDKIMDIANQPISDLEKKKSYETEEHKNDPKSSESIAARGIMKELGIKIPETATAAFLEKQFPTISSLMARREATAARLQTAKMHEDDMTLRRAELNKRLTEKQSDKLDVEFSKFAEKGNAAYANPRSVVGKNEGVISSADKALSYIGSIDPDKATETNINEMARLVDSMLAQGAATVGGSKKVLESMETLKGDIGKIERYLGGSPTSARRGDFVKALMKNVSDIKEESQRQNRESLKQLALAHPNVIKNREIELENYLKMKNLLGPEETVSDFLKSGKVGKPSAEGKKQTQKVSSSELKALVASKKQNPHNKSESEVADYLKNNGYDVEGY